MLAAFPVTKLSIAMTRCPSANRRSVRCDPRNPAPPVTTETGLAGAGMWSVLLIQAGVADEQFRQLARWNTGLPVCAPSGFLTCCPSKSAQQTVSGVRLRWAHRLESLCSFTPNDAKKENMAETFRILAYSACFVGQTFCCNFSDFSRLLAYLADEKTDAHSFWHTTERHFAYRQLLWHDAAGDCIAGRRRSAL